MAKRIPAKKYRTSSSKHQQMRMTTGKLRFLIFVAIFAVIGVILLLRSFAATTVGSVEAESLMLASGNRATVADSAASGGMALLLTASEPATGTINLSAPSTNIVMRAKGMQCKGAPQAVVSIDGKQVLLASVSASNWTEYNTSQVLAAGNHTISVILSNPGSVGKKCTRSLTVDTIQAVDATEPASSDTSAPTTSIASPGNGSTVAGIVAVKANASDNVAVTKVEFYVDSKLASSVTASPFNYSWDTSTVANASHTLSTKAYDAAGNSASSSVVAVSVNNQTAVSTNPSGVAMPSGDVTSNGHTWKPILSEDFTKDAALGSWNDSGTLTSCPSNADAAVYTGSTGVKWASYPKCYKDTYNKRNYRPDQVLSVHDGTLDFWLHTVDGHPAGANPGPIMPDGTRYMTYGRFEARFRTTTTSISDYYTAWLLWPKNEADWQCAESDFPENQLSSANTNAFHHYGCTGSQDYYTKAMDRTQWHTYTQEWQPGKRTYYIDGVKIGESTNQVYTGPERWQLQTETHSSCDQVTPNTCTQDGHLLVDWAVVYAY